MRNRISVQIAVAVSILALLGSIAASVLYYFHIYKEEVEASQHVLLQLGQTVQNTAAIAAYMNDNELAKEVVHGLANNEIVYSAKLTSLTGLSIPPVVPKPHAADQTVHLNLESPFSPGESVGELIITMRHEYINERAIEAAMEYAIVTCGYSFFIALTVFFLIQWRLISGIKQVANKLNHIIPGHAERLISPTKHQHDEVGGLIKDINQLLNVAQSKLDSERALLTQVESLEKRFRMIYERAGVGVFLMNQHARLIMANPAFREITGDAVFARILNNDINCITDLFGETDKTLQLIEDTFKNGELSDTDLLISLPDKQQRWVHCLLTPVRDDSNDTQDHDIFIQGIITDITNRKHEEQKIRFQAERDPLTHLLNRRSAQHSLRLLLEKSQFENSCIAVCQIDLDNFKPINDTHGHDAGDKVLVEAANRLTTTMRSSDLVSRLGGDEFLLGIQGVSNRNDIESMLKKLISRLTEKIDIGNGVSVQIGASIGVALSPDHSTDIEQLMTLADKAMYQVKKRGKNGFQFYDSTQP